MFEKPGSPSTNHPVRIRAANRTHLKILVIKTRAMGDTVLMTAVLGELSQAFPHSEIHAVVKAEWAPVLENLPGVTRVWKLESCDDGFGRSLAFARLALRLRRETFDCVIGLHASSSSSLLALATGAPIRSIHFHGHGARNRYSTVEVPGKGTIKPIIERDMDALRALNINVPAGRLPKVFLQKIELQQAESYLDQLDLPAPIIGLNLGASRPTKCWPIDRFAALAVDWCVQKNGSVFAFTGPGETELLTGFLKSVDDFLRETVSSDEKRCSIRTKIFATNELSVRQLAGILSRISVLAGNDSGPKHLGVAVGIPTVTFFGPEHPFEWHPYPRDRHPYFFIEELTCRRDGTEGMPPWCGLQECIVEQHKCLRLIGVDEVLATCSRICS